MIQHVRIHPHALQSIRWQDHVLIDDISQQLYHLERGFQQFGKALDLPCPVDTAIQSEDGEYTFLYAKRGKSGVLLKNGKILREIVRDDYHHATYEYPASFIYYQRKNYLIHCPLEYRRLEIEDVETGQLISNIKTRQPADIFHSRLKLSPNKTQLLTQGWLWHPWDVIQTFDIAKCMEDPHLLDVPIVINESISSELSGAEFLDNERILISSSPEEVLDEDREATFPPNHLGIWNLATQQVEHKVKIHHPLGTLFLINPKYAWSCFEFPKIINIYTGEIIAEFKNIKSGQQVSSIIPHLEDQPQLAFNHHTKQLAILNADFLDILSPDISLLR